MYKLIETEDGCLWIENQVHEIMKGVFVHWDIYKWTPSKVRYFKDAWHSCIVKKLLKAYGEVYAIPPSAKEDKLIRMFGFINHSITPSGHNILVYSPRMHQDRL